MLLFSSLKPPTFATHLGSGALILLLVSGCYPTVPSSTCTEQISNCLAACEGESQEQKELTLTGSSQHMSATPCERRCHAQCSGSAAPRAAATSPASPNAGPTGAAEPVPTPQAPPIEPLPEPTVEPTNEPDGESPVE